MNWQINVFLVLLGIIAILALSIYLLNQFRKEQLARLKEDLFAEISNIETAKMKAQSEEDYRKNKELTDDQAIQKTRELLRAARNCGIIPSDPSTSGNDPSKQDGV